MSSILDPFREYAREIERGAKRLWGVERVRKKFCEKEWGSEVVDGGCKGYEEVFKG